MSVLAVMDHATHTFERLNRDARSGDDHALDIEDAKLARAAVAELIAAALPFARRNSSEPTVPVSLSTEDVTRLRAALAKVEGVA